MMRVEGKNSRRSAKAEPTIMPCNFRSAGRLSNESARTLTTLHEALARNLTNSLDVYLGTGLDVRMISVEQFTMDEFRAKCSAAVYMLPCAAKPSSSTVLLELDRGLMFTMIDLLLGGSGANPEGSRELTEIDEEIMEGVSTLIAGQIERVWQPLGFTDLEPGRCIKPNLAHRVFPATEKILRVRFDVSVADLTGSLFIAFQASLGGHLVRNARTDSPGNKDGGAGFALPPLKQRILDCMFSVTGELPELKVSVRDLTRIEPGTVLTLTAPAGTPGRLMLEGKGYFDAAAVGQGNNKAMQLLNPVRTRPLSADGIEGGIYVAK
jgi:flagellar motor switch protein FliM